MKKYRVRWMERHSFHVFGKSEEEAVNEALRRAMADSCDYQTVVSVEEIECEHDGEQKLGICLDCGGEI